MKICVDVLKVDIASQNTLSDKVIVHFDVLCPRLEHRVPIQIDVAHVVAVKGSWILDGYAQILENPLESYGFTCGHRRASVFRLCARKSDGQLLFATLGYGSVVEGENKSGG